MNTEPFSIEELDVNFRRRSSIPSGTSAQSAELEKTLNPFGFGSLNRRGITAWRSPKPFNAAESTPFIYSSGDQFFGIEQPLKSLSNETIASLVVNWLATFQRQPTLYIAVIDRINRVLDDLAQRAEERSASLYFEEPLDTDSAARFLETINRYEIVDQTPVNYTDEELGLT